MVDHQARDDEAVPVLVVENDPHQSVAYAELFADSGYFAERALPNQDIQRLCQRLQPAVALIDMAIWEADSAYVFGVLNGAVGFARPIIVALASLPHQVRRAKRFGADGVWIRGVDDAAALPRLVGDLIEQRDEGKLKPKTPSTPL
ncbi:MAG TPA: response regulator [Candidatus Dormibacteraeota bacterium]